MLPLEVLKVSPAGTVKPVATLNTPLADVAATLFTVSPVKALSTFAAPATPSTPVAVSLLATIGATGINMMTVTVAVLQLSRLAASQI